MTHQAKKVHTLWNSNIFLLFERYLEKPSYALEEAIRVTAQSIYLEALENAKVAVIVKKTLKLVKTNPEPSKEQLKAIKVEVSDIGADNYDSLIFNAIKLQAQEAYSISGRMIKNSKNINDEDPEYIYKVSEEQSKMIYQLMVSFFEDITRSAKVKDRSEVRCPSAVVFAFGGFVERHKSSQFGYCKKEEAQLYDSYAGLCIKEGQLLEDKPTAASAVLYACRAIKGPMEAYSNGDSSKMQSVVDELQTLKANKEVQQHRGLKKKIANFLILIWGIIPGLIVLGLTEAAGFRESFFYRPNTDTENKVDALMNNVKSLDKK